LFLGAYLKLCSASLRLPRSTLLLGLTLSQPKALGATDEENAQAQVCNSLDLCLIACEFFLNSHDSSNCRKPLAADPLDKLAQRASSSHATLVARSAGVTGSTSLSAVEAWDYCRRAAEFLEGLKNREADQEGTPLLLYYLFLSISLADLWPSYLECWPIT
jgi:hypothetical protein